MMHKFFSLMYYFPQHVSSTVVFIFRTNFISAASGIFTPFRLLFSTRVTYVLNSHLKGVTPVY